MTGVESIAGSRRDGGQSGVLGSNGPTDSRGCEGEGKAAFFAVSLAFFLVQAKYMKYNRSRGKTYADLFFCALILLSHSTAAWRCGESSKLLLW